MPPLAAAFVRKGKGEPRAILREALSFRGHTKRLRPLLDKLSRRVRDGDPEDEAATLAEIREWCATVARYIGKGAASNALGAVDFSIDAIGITSVKPASFLRWLRDLPLRRALVALTDASRLAAPLLPAGIEMSRLRRLAFGG